MAKAAKVKVRVSTQPVVVMEAEVARKIRQHARTSMKAEVCGVLIGSTEHERMMVEACIQGINATQGGAHVTFTQDTWEHIYKIKDKDYPDRKIVGWYHSHPGFGVFLSEHDLFIQQNFFSNPQQVAWVYDPHTDEEGCFGWIGDKIEKLTAIRVGFTQSMEAASQPAGDYEESDDAAADAALRSQSEPGGSEEPVWVRWASLALGYVAVVILGFAGGFLFRDRQLAPFMERYQLNQLIMEHPIEACRALLENLRLAPGPGAGAPIQSPQPQPAQAQPEKAQPEKAPLQKDNHAKH